MHYKNILLYQLKQLASKVDLFLRKKSNYVFVLLLPIIFSFFLLIPTQVKASHAMAVDLTYQCLGNNRYEFTMSFYRDCKGISAPSNPILDINSASCGIHTQITLMQSGPGVEVSAICNASLPNTTCNGGTLPGVQKYVYKGQYTLPLKCDDWIFSYSECCRNNLITNLATKEDIYVEAMLNNNVAPCNSSPTFTSLPVPYICNGQPYVYNNGIVDADGDSMVYSLINPLEGPGKPVGYKPGYSASNPILTTGAFLFNDTTGDISLTPAGLQVCVLAVQVKEFKNGILIGSTMRDMQVIVSNCTNIIPEIGPIQNQTGGMLAGNQIQVCPGEHISFDVLASDGNGDNITLSTNIASSIPGASFTTVLSGSHGTGSFSWTPTVANMGLNTFTVTVKDDACQVSGQQTYSYSINVLSGTSAGADKSYCTSGGPVQLNAIGGTTFSWTLLGGGAATSLSCTNCPDPKASPAVTSTYIVTSNYSASCSNKDTITVSVVSDFNLVKSPDTKICNLKDGAPISMTPGPDPVSSYTYSWSPAESLSDPYIYNPVATPTITTKYYCTVTSAAGCKKTDTVTVQARNLIDLSIIPGDSVEVCDSVQLDLLLEPIGELFTEPFDHEIDSTNWSSISGGILSQQCGTFSEDSYYLNQIGNRLLTTKTLDVSKGGVVSFYIKAGFCDQCTCDKPENDEEDENFYLDYSTDGGVTWKQLKKMDADIFSPKNGFEKITLTIPDSAKSTSTQFRWYQINHFPDKDVWILDNIVIKAGLGDYKYLWSPASTLSNDTIKNPVAFPAATTMYTVRVTDTLTGCVYIDSIKVIFKKEFDVITLPQVIYCPKDPAFKIQVEVTAGKVYTYSWSPTADVSDPKVQNPDVSPDTSTQYTVVITDAATGCYRRETVFVKVPPSFTVHTIADTSVCSSHQVQLNATVSPSDSYDYLWRPVSGLSDQSAIDPVAAPTSTSDYILFVKNQTTGCIKADTVNVKVYPDFDLETSGTRTLCPYATGVDISAAASPGTYTYLWDSAPGITDPTNPSQFVIPSGNTVYSVLCHDVNGCWKRDTISVRLYTGGNIQLQTSNDTLINEGDAALLSATGAPAYIWKLENTVIDSLNKVLVSPETKTVYTVQGYDACYIDSAKVVVDVTPLTFFIPNLITPNGDGENENFKITNFGKRWNLEIYNRWGKLTYSKEKYIDEWRGENESDGVYYYHILDTKTNQNYKGWVQIAR